jgi:hypothetical protein
VSHARGRIATTFPHVLSSKAVYIHANLSCCSKVYPDSVLLRLQALFILARTRTISHCHQPPRPLFPECHQPPQKCHLGTLVHAIRRATASSSIHTQLGMIQSAYARTMGHLSWVSLSADELLQSFTCDRYTAKITHRRYHAVAVTLPVVELSENIQDTWCGRTQ